MPEAPERMAEVMARFIARRKLTRLASCSAIDCATRSASSSGRLISVMLTCTFLPVMSWISRRNASTSAPDLPMTMPGRAVQISMTILFVSLRITMSERPAWPILRRMCLRIARSSCKNSA